MELQARKPTITTVAERAGVAVSTVSRVLNGGIRQRGRPRACAPGDRGARLRALGDRPQPEPRAAGLDRRRGGVEPGPLVHAAPGGHRGGAVGAPPEPDAREPRPARPLRRDHRRGLDPRAPRRRPRLRPLAPPRAAAPAGGRRGEGALRGDRPGRARDARPRRALRQLRRRRARWPTTSSRLGHTRIAFAGGPRDSRDTSDRLRGLREGLLAHRIRIRTEWVTFCRSYAAPVRRGVRAALPEAAARRHGGRAGQRRARARLHARAAAEGPRSSRATCRSWASTASPRAPACCRASRP